MSLLPQVDQFLFSYVGYPYMRITRDDSSFERILYLIQFLRSRNERVRLLDVGCGGAISLYMVEREIPDLISGFVGADFKASRLYARYKDFKTPHEFHDTNLDDDWNFGQFDVAWCSECLEHIVDDNGVFKKICRSVKPGGHIVVSMPSEAYRESNAGNMPELMETSPTQDGGHVRVGYTPESLVELERGTSAELVQVDAITRSNAAYLRRRYRWSSALQPLRNTYYTLTRNESDFYTLSAKPGDLKEFQSIAAVYRVA
jgi:SAM-dependent methyltransferase